MNTTKKYVIVLQDVSSKRFFGMKLGLPRMRGTLESLSFAQTFATTARALNRCASLNTALAKKDALTGKHRAKRFVVRFIGMEKWLNSDSTAANPRRPAL